MSEEGVPSEVEAKLLVPNDSDVRAIGRLRALGAYRLEPRRAEQLHSVYLDTEDFALALHGVALRVRRSGRRWEATAKWAGSVRDGVHDRPELTVDLPSPPGDPFEIPDGPLRLHLAALLAGRALRPIVITDIRRRHLDVLPADVGPAVPADVGPAAPAASAAHTSADTLADLSIDKVELRGPDDDKPRASYTEVEVEQRAGTRDDVAEVARLLLERFELTQATDTKFARGLWLLYGQDLHAVHDLGAVTATDTVGLAVRKVVSRYLRDLRARDPQTRVGTDPEALHGMRVATRRLRSAVRMFEPEDGSKQYDVFGEELRWLGHQLAAVRDLDVQIALLERHASALPQEQVTDLAPLRKFLQDQRTAQRQHMLVALDSKRYYRLLIKLERFGARPPRQPRSGTPGIGIIGAERIEAALRQLRRRAKRAARSPTPEALHAVRIGAKRLRYLLEFLRELTGKPGRKLIKHLVALQDLLGEHQDAIVANELIRRYVEAAGRDLPPTVLLTLGALMSMHLHVADRAREGFRRARKRFERKRTLGEVAEVLEALGAGG